MICDPLKEYERQALEIDLIHNRPIDPDIVRRLMANDVYNNLDEMSKLDGFDDEYGFDAVEFANWMMKSLHLSPKENWVCVIPDDGTGDLEEAVIDAMKKHPRGMPQYEPKKPDKK